MERCEACFECLLDYGAGIMAALTGYDRDRTGLYWWPTEEEASAMAGLRALPPDMLYVVSGGKEFIDHHGNVYVREEPMPHVASPATETDWRAGLPSVALNAKSVALVKELKEGMASLDREYFLSVGIGRSGEIVFEHWQAGDHQHCDVSYDDILREARESGAQGVLLAHNHPDGSDYMSEADQQLTRQLE
jgi:hypothetical protein